MCSFGNLAGLSTSGAGLSQEEVAVLEVEALRVQNEGNYSSVQFWGKIFGGDADYLVCSAYGAGTDWPNKTFFACSTGTVLSKLVELPAADAANPSSCEGGFTGNGDRVIQEATEGDDEEKSSGEVREAHVLANVVADVDNSTAVVPKGAWVVDPTHNVVKNRMFSGLSAREAGDVDSYLHFRKPTAGSNYAQALDRHGMVKPQDFLEKISSSHPVGGWGLQSQDNGVTTLRSLLYPGYFFFHKAGSSEYGGAYFGNGERNADVAFML